MDANTLIGELLDTIELGSATCEGPLTLVPVFGAKTAPEYLIGADAFDLGVLKVEEHNGGVVPDIAAINDSKLPVLLLDGEHLQGARQDRIMNVSVLLPAKSRTVVPVSCVEAGRWHYETGHDFAPSPDHSYARLRRVQAEATVTAAMSGARRRADQSAVWEDVALKQLEADVRSSSSGALRDAFARQSGLLERIMARFASPAPAQTGVIAAIGGRPIAMDVFDKPATLGKMWARLVRAYGMDVVGATDDRPRPGVIEEFVATARLAHWSVHPGIGIGTDLVAQTRTLVGSGLAWDEGVPHLALFTRDHGSSGTGGPRRAFFHS